MKRILRFLSKLCKDVGDPSILINNASIDPKVTVKPLKII